MFVMKQNNPEVKSTKPLIVPQLLAATAVSLGASCAGGWMSFTSVAIPKMMQKHPENQTELEGDPIQIDLFVGSWIASLFFIGNIVGCLLGGLINQKLGARKTFLISSPLAVVTWVMIALSHHIWIILLSRIISGIIFGVFQANGKVYNAEIAHPDMRGSLGTIMSNMFAFGSIYTYLIGYLVSSWRMVAWLQLIPTCFLGITVLFIPDSPYWLVEKGREDEARESLVRLRGSSYDVDDEFKQIISKKKAKELEGKSVKQTMCSRVFLVPFLRIGALMMITQWTGTNVITSYMVNIFMDSGSSIDPEIA